MIEIERDEESVVLHRGFLDDPRLSFRAKGLLAYLLTRPAGAQVDLRSLGVPGAELLSSIRELEAAGYFVRAGAASGESDPLHGAIRETSTLPLLEPLPRRAPSERSEKKAPDEGNEEAESSAAERVLTRLNELRQSSWIWARFTPLSSRHAKNVEHIKGRLREGYREADLILVLEYLASVDGGKDESRRFFDSVTPFNTKNFERNLTMAREWEARGRPQRPNSLALDRPSEHDPAIYERWAERGGRK